MTRLRAVGSERPASPVPLINLDYERIVLAGMLAGNPDGLEEVLLSVREEDFTDPDRGALFAAILARYARGAPITEDLVADDLPHLDRKRFGELVDRYRIVVGDALGGYAERIADLATRRRMIAFFAGALETAADPARPLDEIRVMLDRASSRLDASASRIETVIDIAVIVEREYPQDWVVPNLIERTDRIIVTGGEGLGKSTWLRQMGVQIAAGIHPVNLFPIPGGGRRVLLIDLENSEAAISRSLAPLYRLAPASASRMAIRSRPQGIDLLRTIDVAWLDRLMAQVEPELLIIGPVYKMAGGAPKDEEVAHELASVLDRLRVRYGTALLMEHHSPHGEGNDRARWRPFGASLWLRWPEFGFGLREARGGEVDVLPWRGARDRNRPWPKKLRLGGTWPWEAIG